MQTSKTPVRIAIIGGGASGVISLIKCREAFGAQASYTIFEPEHILGLGRAYSTQEAVHLLNVPAGRMWLDAEQPNQFIEWLSEHHPEFSKLPSAPFFPRRWYGEFLRHELAKIPVTAYEHVRTKITHLENSQSEWTLKQENGLIAHADFVLIATGYEAMLAQDTLRIVGEIPEDRVLQPNQYAKINQIKSNESVMVLGASLTAIDIFLQLRKNLATPIHFISRHGFVPLANDGTKSAGPKLQTQIGKTPAQILKTFREYKRAGNRAEDFADQLRPEVQLIWKSWNQNQQRRFKLHLKTYWEVIRHRMPVNVAALFQADQSAKKVRVHAGKIKESKWNGQKIEVSYHDRHLGNDLKLSVDRIILASGARLNAQLRNPSEDALGVFRVGPAARDELWEIGSVPDIAPQVDAIVKTLSPLISSRG